MEIREIEYQSDLYKEVIQLRDKILRKPIGRSIADDDLTVEKDYIHIAVIDDGRVIGTCQFKPLDDHSVLMKQVCIDDTYQGRQIGRRMFEASEEILRKKGITHIDVHARHTALGYYLKMGFVEVGETFIEVGLLHHGMSREIA